MDRHSRRMLKIRLLIFVILLLMILGAIYGLVYINVFEPISHVQPKKPKPIPTQSHPQTSLIKWGFFIPKKTLEIIAGPFWFFDFLHPRITSNV